MIRTTQGSDTRAILALASRTGVFKPHEITALEEVLSDYHAANAKLDHRAITFEEHGEILGFAYFAPAAMADRTWYLYWIAVTKPTQARGIGTQLLEHVEEDIRARRGRILLVETSSLPYYDLTRKFYEKHQYQCEAVIKDFYADGDSMLIYSKRLTE
ncbi:MAG: GNAT family N-acetyltransferase [Pirellulales bacterium]